MTARRIGMVVVLWAALALALALDEARPAVMVLGGVIAAAVTLVFVAIDLVRAGAPLAWARAPRPAVRGATDPDVDLLARQIRSSLRTRSSGLRQVLIDLAAERCDGTIGERGDLPPRMQALSESTDLRLRDIDELHTLVDEIEVL